MNYCIVLASGKGTRMGHTSYPKQFLKVNGKPLIVYTLETLSESKIFDHVFVGIKEEFRNFTDQLLMDYPLDLTKITLVNGADKRMDTFFNTYNFIKNRCGITDQDFLCLTDANRPFVPVRVYQQCLNKAQQYDISCPARRIVDGICVSSDGITINKIPSKEYLYSFQTPELFRATAFDKAYQKLSEEQKNELLGACEIFSATGVPPAIVESTNDCFKVTTAYDLKLAEIIAQEKSRAGRAKEVTI